MESRNRKPNRLLGYDLNINDMFKIFPMERRTSNNLGILINEYATRAIKVKKDLLGRKNGWKIPII